MKWISVKDKLPDKEIIVAIMQGRQERAGDPIEDARIVILRDIGSEYRDMDSTTVYFLPCLIPDECDRGFCSCNYYYLTISYWLPWEEFGFPEDMICKEDK